MRLVFGMLLALWIAPALAQDSPGYPCQGCVDDQPLFTVPTSALWYVVGRPGTGLSMTVQGGYVVGTYYGFTETGAPLWYLFTGPLERPADAPNRLRLTANLQRVENGPCLGCAWQAPDFLESPGEAVLEFDQANHATLAIGGAEPLSMVPFIAGVGYSRLLPSYTDYDFPDLDGTWIVVHEVPQPDGSWAYSSRIGTLSFSGAVDEVVGWSLTEGGDYRILLGQCRFNFDMPGSDDPHSHDVPDCWLSDMVNLPGNEEASNGLYFPVPYANIGASRISAVHPETGVRLTMYRLEYD